MARTKRREVEPNRTMPYWLAEGCRIVRKERRISQERVAKRAGVAKTAINRFERQRRWPLDPETMVAAYAELCEIRNEKGKIDSRVLWRGGINLWLSDGKDATLPVQDPVATAGWALAQGLDAFLQERHQASRPSSARSRAAKKRREAG